jgi:hypothetical protein
MIKDIEQAIVDAQKKVDELKLSLKEEKLKSPDKKLATSLHSILCKYNHTDGCGWFYEFKDKKDDWGASSHGEYLKKAQNLIHKCKDLNIEPESAIDIVRMVNRL